MKKSHSIQYTLRSIEPRMDKILRQKARESHKSLNEVVLEAVSHGIGLDEQTLLLRDLDDLAGTWKDDPEFEAALLMQDKIDEKLWT